MAQTTATQHPRDRLRGRIDRGVQAAVTVSGLLVLMTLMLIFVYLLFAVLPLFKPASLGQAQPLPIDASGPALALGMDVQQRIGYRIDAQGAGQFYRLAPPQGGKTAEPLAQQTLLAKPALLSQAAGERDLFALAQADGRFVIAQADFTSAETALPQWAFPLGQRPLALDKQGRSLQLLTLAEAHRNQYLLAGVTQDNRLVFGRFSPDRAPQLSALALEGGAQQLVLTPDGRQLYLLAGNRLARYQIDGAQLQLSETRTLGERPPYRLTALPGGSALLITGADGNTREWFDVEKNSRWQLTPVQHFDHLSQPQDMLAAEPYRRVFATLRPDGGFSLFSSIQPQPLLNGRLSGAVTRMAFAPRGDGLLLETAEGWQRYAIDNPYPDVTWRSLWGKVWYENYPQPAYVWQSTSGEDSYQPKFSLVPVIFGTFKAAAYAMLFAIPLALAGAIYTAYFMTRGLRRVIKPAIEVMGALPTVVIGLVAGIWLAPVIEHYLLAVLSLPLLLAAVVLLCGGAVNHFAPRRPAGVDLLILLPLLALTVWLAFSAGPWLEVAIFGAPLHFWLGDDYDQRNALVVGVAMGFALVPIIFSLAEDALFSVPATLSQGSLALGATQWQTVVRVVLPSASAGIFSALMIGFGRAVGETMIVLMATGNTPIIDGSLFQGLRALAANIAIEMPEAVSGSSHYRVLFLTALVLFVFTFVFNTLAEAVRLRLRERYTLNQEAP
ncbi:Phosphate transport system permease protein pstC [Serratia entomophila]|jgi:phosphate transport system permease protein|uniref:ABC transporter permease subunit n=1 Tax=Serratia entomophila TaxID=42906 RepID=UPI001F265A38|nr:ABC transporter permease subunit [Serratia entomophila]UIW17272.1 ABC transporter permease subunit [Serratia entomophila]CAI0828452.1 Phosphate transport system permease protein pstC [Serratia entomophila]CAI0978977.1 Phosphate transport system permease protein pstC [Serratia entomophila]CAI1062111.1 Phosphate transport system permease protein pstC [Serratia entomophila]CAI1064601.1 Phosphate transport system permease protein pstC [Serratia entomophila]